MLRAKNQALLCTTRLLEEQDLCNKRANGFNRLGPRDVHRFITFILTSGHPTFFSELSIMSHVSFQNVKYT